MPKTGRDGSKRLKLENMVALNAKLTNGSECQTEKIWWYLNAKLTNGSKCQTEKICWYLNAKLTNGFECQTEKYTVTLKA